MECLAAGAILVGPLSHSARPVSAAGLLLALTVGAACIAAGWFAARPPRLRTSVQAGAIA
jgi:hypothetical protein